MTPARSARQLISYQVRVELPAVSGVTNRTGYGIVINCTVLFSETFKQPQNGMHRCTIFTTLTFEYDLGLISRTNTRICKQYTVGLKLLLNAGSRIIAGSLINAGVLSSVFQFINAGGVC